MVRGREPRSARTCGRRSRRCSRSFCCKTCEMNCLLWNAGLSRSSARTINAGAFSPPAAVGAVQVLAQRLLSMSSAEASFNSVNGGGKKRRAVSIIPSPSWSPTRFEALWMTPGPFAVAHRYVPPFPASSHSPQLMEITESRTFGRD